VVGKAVTIPPYKQKQSTPPRMEAEALVKLEKAHLLREGCSWEKSGGGSFEEKYVPPT
jgi:hypothetical protein